MILPELACVSVDTESVSVSAAAGPPLDQQVIGTAVAAAGAGRVPAPVAAPEQVRDAVRDLLADGPHHASAAAIGARIHGLDGAGTAAGEIEAVLSSPVAQRST